MLCQNCKSRKAIIYYTKIVNGERMDIRLCETCAKNNFNLHTDNQFDISDFLTSVIDLPLTCMSIPQADNQDKTTGYKCKNCGLTFDEFKQNGILGCSKCYIEFKDRLKPILKRIHGNVRHSAKHPSTDEVKINSKIEQLRYELNKAIKDEKYEDAAKIRDEIKEIENTESHK